MLQVTRKDGKEALENMIRRFNRKVQQSGTLAKAKELRPAIEKLVTKSKLDSVARRRFVLSRLGNNNNAELKKLFTEIAPKFVERAGGYTRVLKLAPRSSDASPMAIIEFVE